MSSGIVQLVAIGAQDTHLIGNPEVSFFRSNFKRHTNFSIFHQSQKIQGEPKPNGTSTIRFDRLGDLLNYTYLSVDYDNTSNLVSVWSNIVDSAELWISGQMIDKQDVVFSQEIAIDTLATSYSKSFPASLAGGLGSQSFFYPFRFFFCENWMSSIPLVSLQYVDVEIKINWAANFDTGLRCDINACYISLDTAERRYFTQTEQNLLIFQVQKSLASLDKTQDLTFNHPVKFIASSNAVTNNLVSRVNKVKLTANGNDITDYKISVPNFTAVQSYYHTEYSSGNNENMFLYSFGLNTNKFQPSGTLNFSRLDSFIVHCSETIDQPIYAVNYNILKIKNGMAGVMYSN